jgi:hypothetical protein
MTWIHIPHTTSSTVSADTADSASDSDSPSRTPSSGRSPISSGTNTANRSSASVSAMDSWMTLPSGTTSSPSTDDPGVERWIFSVLASRVNLTQMPDYARAPMMTETSGPIPSESLGRWDQDSSFWRTSQASLWELMDGHHTGAPWSESWPRQGMTRNGELYPLRTRERHINETGGGSWHIPTPTSADVYTGNMESSQQSDDSMHSVSLPDFVGRFPTPRAGKTTDEDEESWPARHAEGKVATPPLALAARMLPTPRTRGLLGGSGSREMVQAMVLDGTMSEEEGVALLGVKLLPTPSSGGESGGPHGIRGGSWAKKKLVETFGEEDAVAMSGGSLSPDWTSWLMGLPVGWTSLEPLPREEYDEWFQAQLDGTWWQEERGLPRIATGIPDRVNRLKCLGNGIVPASLSLFLRGTR